MRKAVSLVFLLLPVLAMNNSANTTLSIEPTVIEEQRSSMEGENLLNAKAFPNPLSINSLITYDLGKNSNVVLSLYDCQGRLVKQLLDEQQEYGPQKFFLERGNLSPGIYFLNIRSDYQMASLSIAVVD